MSLGSGAIQAVLGYWSILVKSFDNGVESSLNVDRARANAAIDVPGARRILVSTTRTSTCDGIIGHRYLQDDCLRSVHIYTPSLTTAPQQTGQNAREVCRVLLGYHAMVQRYIFER